MKSNITSMYRNNSERILQGDILNNIKIPIYTGEFSLNNSEYAVILSQDCDLSQDFKSRRELIQKDSDSIEDYSTIFNKMIPSMLLCPAYPADQLRQGKHLNFMNMSMRKISNPKKTPWKNIVNNETPRYHFLRKSEEFHIPDIVLDFKRYYSVSSEYLYSIYPDCYITSLNELYREDLSNRFYNYHSRIGLP